MTTAGYSDPWLLYGVGRHQGIKLTEAVDDGTSVEADSEFAIVGIDIRDIADVAVIDLLLVIVLDLHDLVAGREDPAESFDFSFAGRIQGRLQFDVERARTDAAPVHRAQHLYIPDGIEAEATRDASFYQLDNAGNCSFRIIRLDKIEVTLARPIAGFQQIPDRCGARSRGSPCRDQSRARAACWPQAAAAARQ